MKTCPDASELEALAADRVDADRSEALWAHLESCADCRSIYEQAGSRDSLLAPLRAILRENRPGNSPTGDMPVIPGYELRREAARTHFSVVYEAVQRATGQRVAIKVMALPGLHDARLRRRFEREVELLATLRHPNIVPIYDSGTAGGYSFFIMPFIDGAPLDAYVVRGGLTIRDRLLLLRTLCEAVSFAHQRGVIHRDLKPSNIHVDETGCVRVLDFGLAKLLTADDAAEQTLTAGSGQLLGTPSYMSPEQAAGRMEEVDVRSDVYALGMVMYRVLTGAMPYPVDGPLSETLEHIQKTDPVPPRVHVPDMDADLETVVLKALSKERDRRYQSVAELARDIAHVLDGAPIDARRDSYTYVLRKTLRRHRVAAAVALGYGVLVTAALISSLMLWRHAEDRRKQADIAEARAEVRFNQVRHLANTLIFDVHEQIKDLPGTTGARTTLLKTAREYIESLSKQVEEDRELAVELAQAGMRLGNVLGNPNYAHQGDFATALAVYEQSLSIIRPFFEAQPDDMSLANLMQNLHTKIGDVLSVRGRKDEAMAHYLEAERIILKALDRDPDAIGPLRSLVVCRARIGKIHDDQGRLQESFDECVRRIEMCRQIAALPTAEAGDTGLLAAALRTISELHQRFGRLDEALAAAEESRDLIVRLAAAHPDRLSYQRDVAVAHNVVGDIYRLMNRPDLLLAVRRESLAAHQALAERDPGDARARRDVFISHVHIGDAYMAMNRPTEALAGYQAGFDVLLSIAPPETEETLPQRDYALIHYKLGEALQKAERIEEAHEQYQRSLDYAIVVSGRDPSDANGLRLLSATYDVLGETELTLGRVGAALEHFGKSLEMSRRLLDQAPQDAVLERDMVISLAKMGTVNKSLAAVAGLEAATRAQRWSEAREWFSRALDLTHRMKAGGRLAPIDEYFVTELTAEIQTCDTALAEASASLEAVSVHP